MDTLGHLSIPVILTRLLMAAAVGGLIGYERRLRHKAIGVAGMVLVATGSTTYMLLARQVASVDPQAVGRAIQGLLQGIGFLGGAVIFKGGNDVRGIKTAAAIWITGAVGMAIGVELPWLGVVVGVATALVLLIADLTPRGRTPAVVVVNPTPPGTGVKPIGKE
jgi:putative Mg2+ transporter-C (MgtC) family protein